MDKALRESILLLFFVLDRSTPRIIPSHGVIIQVPGRVERSRFAFRETSMSVEASDVDGVQRSGKRNVNTIPRINVVNPWSIPVQSP